MEHVGRPWRLLRRFAKRNWQALGVALLAVALGVAAYISPGLVEAEVRLDEGTVYAGNRATGLVGTINVQIDQLSDAAAVGGSEFQVLQHEDLVLVHSIESGDIAQYHPGRNTMSVPTRLPAEARVQLVGKNLLVVNPQDGRAWYGPAERIITYDFDKEHAALQIGENGTATLTTNGHLIGLDPNRSVLVRVGAAGEEITELPFQVDPLGVELSAVGDKALVLDRTSGRIWLEGMPKAFDVSGATGAKLMAPAPDALKGEDGTRAIYATSAGLIALTPDGPRSLSGQLDGKAITPVQVGECVYGAFDDQFVRKCVGQEPHLETIPQFESNESVTFLTNRSTVALGDLDRGYVWLVNKGMLLISNWDDVTTEEPDDEETNPDLQANRPRDLDQPNRPPVAADDNLKARAGRSTILPVLDNDTDPDGDVMTITAPAEVDGARISPVRSGAGLQISVDPTASGTVTFSYEIADGHPGGTDSATVTIDILPLDPAEANTAPAKFALARQVEVAQRQILTKQVLLDWRDADGDPLMLKNAWLAQGSEDRINFTSDGTLTFTDVGKSAGTKTVHLEVSDGYATTQGTLDLSVQEEPVAPIAHGDFITTTVGEPVEVEPITNDIGYSLRLSEVSTDCETCTLQENYPEDKFTFTAASPGTYYLPYIVRSAQPATGLVRVDVREPGTGNAPSAALDVAMLPPDGSVLIDPLLNDADPDGDVLVLQTVSQHPGVEVMVERRQLITITAVSQPKQPITLEYRVSDGTHSVIGHIVVVPTETTGSLSPQPEDDVVNARADNTVTARVLANDLSPVGLDLSLERLTRNPFGEDAWIDGEVIRIRAPHTAQAMSSSIDYEVKDSDGRLGVATLNVEVSAEDSNAAAPRPRKVVGRVLAGTTIRVPIDLTGIDPSGSSVRLVGIASGPKLGRVIEVGDEYLRYEAFPGSQGTDTFRYEVINRLGMRAAGQIRIGVAPPGAENNPPTGVTDELRVRPGRNVQLAPLTNDFDLDGDTLGFAPQTQVTFDDERITPTVIDNREITFTAPNEAGAYAGSYPVVDSRGQLGQGRIVVQIDENAPLLAPITRMDTVQVKDIADQQWVEVDVLANDYDPDGAQSALWVEVPEPESGDVPARVSDDARKVTVEVLDSMQQIRYRAVDADGNATNGIIMVPGRDDSVPVLRNPTQEIEAVAGQPLVLSLADHVMGTQARNVRLSSADTVSATHGSAVPEGPGSVRYVPHEDYEGPASVVFEVIEEVPEEDSAKTAFVSLRIKVVPPPDRDEEDTQVTNEPPRLVVENPSLQVGAGEEPGRMDLAQLFRDPEGQDVYVDEVAASGEAPIDWSLDGSVLTASTPLGTAPGTQLTLTGSAFDASTGKTPFTMRIVTVSSRRPLTNTVDDQVSDAKAGTPVTIQAAANDLSFLDDKTLTIVGAQVVSGEASISHTGQQVTITPGRGNHGTIIARYSVQDATKDETRNVDGRITVEVKDKPGKPLTPYPEGADDSQVTVTYVSGGDGGSPITRRTATATSPGQAPVVQDCPGLRCTITGLRNGVPWSVSITETNELGTSEPSEPSAPQTPDAKPLPPTRPTVRAGDGELTLNWTHDRPYANATGGSAMRSYQVTLLDSSGRLLGTRSVGPQARSLTWTGLTNGTLYSFYVEAQNERLLSDPSPESAPVSPAGPPRGSQELRVDIIESELGGGFRVTFDPAQVQANGAPVHSYTITALTQAGPTSNSRTLTAASGVTSVDITGQGHTPTRFQLSATNQVGTSVVGQSSTPLVSLKQPKITSVTGTPGNGRLTFNVATNDSAATVQYNIGAGWRPLEGGVISGLTNGESYAVQLRAVLSQSGSSRISTTYTAEALRPKADQPGPLNWDESSLRLNADLAVNANVLEPTWLSAAGWDPGQYQWCAGNSCSSYGRQQTLTLPPGQTTHLNWRWGSYSGRAPLTVQRLREPSYDDDDNRVFFELPHVHSGSCEIISFGERGSRSLTVRASSGKLAYDGAPPALRNRHEEREQVIEQIKVACNFNGASRNWTVEDD